MEKLIIDCDKEWLYWAELFAYLWPDLPSEKLAEMADRMIRTFK